MEQIQLVSTRNTNKWESIVGQETIELLTRLNIAEPNKMRLLSETQAILEQCGNPIASVSKDTGLVFGYVQSGKTMSFTTLTALAKDNGFQIIIIIAGIATNLIDQSTTRLEQDLRINENRQWSSIKNPTLKLCYNNLNDKLQEWKDENFPQDEKRTILITVLKNRTHLHNLIELLAKLDMNGVPTLIIDDESDQASPNTFEQANAKNKTTAEDKLSTIYKSILAIKATLPHHTFVQYTATPQANLFFNIYRELSPKFIQLLSPGEGYTGGKIFFKDRSDLVQTIPELDPTSEKPPFTLLEAMRWFFLGVAKGKSTNENKNRSMMIHPSVQTQHHHFYTNWVTTIKDEWVAILQKPDSDLSKKTLIQEFEVTHKKLAAVATDIPAFNKLTEKLLYAIRGTQIQELNAKIGKTPNINWKQDYAFIVIGGNAMNRGYTVEGLTVTYMPRPIGVGNVDTIQQRARFFGYKHGYINYCRIFLTEESKQAYEDYVAHEEDMRHRLDVHKKSGQALDQWFREVFLPDYAKLTRSNVIYNELVRNNSKEAGYWFFMNAPHKANIPLNQKIARLFVQKIGLTTYNSTTQEYEDIKLQVFLEDFLNKLVYKRQPQLPDWNNLKTQLKQCADANPSEKCRVYLLGSFEKPRKRSIKSGVIGKLFEGARKNYKEEDLKHSVNLSFQIHLVNVFDGSEIIAETVPLIALFVPQGMTLQTIRQTYQLEE